MHPGIRDHMEVIGSDGGHVGRVDHVIGDEIELAKLDLGGGGTVAKYVANQDIDTIDIGVPVLSMHSPFEIVSKADVYMAYLTFKAFCEDAE